ncbi:MATE family efflux transporter, partial [Catenibacterium sp. UBA627]
MDKKKTSVNMLEGSIFKSLVIFMIPILISNIFQQFYNTMDTAIVGNTLGMTSLSAIGSCAAVYDLLVGFALGIGNGLSIVTARSYGSGDEELLKKSVAASFVIGIISSIVITIIASIGIKPLLIAINVSPDLLNEAYSYIIVIVQFLVVMFAYNLCAGLLRAIGNSLMPLVFLIISSVLNIGLDLFFITQLHMGVRGAAVATVIAQGISVVFCLIYIFKNVPLLVPEKRHFKFDAALYKELLGQGYSMAVMSAIVNAGSVILQSGINGLGSKQIIAGHTAARKLYMFFNMPFTAMAQAASTFVSQNKGAENVSRIRKGMKQMYIYDIVVAAIATVILLLSAPTLVTWISGTTDKTVLYNGSLYLR